jgi:hypothetical protein
VCLKADLAAEAWRDPAMEMYVFEAEVFLQKPIPRVHFAASRSWAATVACELAAKVAAGWLRASCDGHEPEHGLRCLTANRAPDWVVEMDKQSSFPSARRINWPLDASEAGDWSVKIKPRIEALTREIKQSYAKV